MQHTDLSLTTNERGRVIDILPIISRANPSIFASIFWYIFCLPPQLWRKIALVEIWACCLIPCIVHSTYSALTLYCVSFISTLHLHLTSHFHFLLSCLSKTLLPCHPPVLQYFSSSSLLSWVLITKICWLWEDWAPSSASSIGPQ